MNYLDILTLSSCLKDDIRAVMVNAALVGGQEFIH